MDPRRSQRVTEALREELDELISYELEDPRAEGVGITEVLLSPDGKKAVVRIFVEGGDERQATAVAALNHAKPFLKRHLGARLTLFRIPELLFEADMSATLGAKADALMRRIKKGRPREAGEA